MRIFCLCSEHSPCSLLIRKVEVPKYVDVDVDVDVGAGTGLGRDSAEPHFRVWWLEGRLPSAIGFLARRQFAFANDVLFSQLGAATNLSRLFVMIAFAQFLGDSAALEQFLEAAQGGADWFAVMDSHS